MSTDRELLELAAKAAGIAYHAFDDDSGCLYLSTYGDVVRSWNPLKRDGDALRLAVKLGMSGVILITQEWTEIYPTLTTLIRENHYGDAYAATRRAIVRAAAEIGKAMP